MTFRTWPRAPPSLDRRPLSPAFLLAYSESALTVGKDSFPTASVPSFRGSLWSCDSQIQSALPLPRPTNHRQQTAVTDQRIASLTESADLMILIRGFSRQGREVADAKGSAWAVEPLPQLGSDPFLARRGNLQQVPQQYESVRVACAVPSYGEG